MSDPCQFPLWQKKLYCQGRVQKSYRNTPSPTPLHEITVKICIRQRLGNQQSDPVIVARKKKKLICMFSIFWIFSIPIICSPDQRLSHIRATKNSFHTISVTNLIEKIFQSGSIDFSLDFPANDLPQCEEKILTMRSNSILYRTATLALLVLSHFSRSSRFVESNSIGFP